MPLLDFIAGPHVVSSDVLSGAGSLLPARRVFRPAVFFPRVLGLRFRKGVCSTVVPCCCPASNSAGVSFPPSLSRSPRWAPRESRGSLPALPTERQWPLLGEQPKVMMKM